MAVKFAQTRRLVAEGEPIAEVLARTGETAEGSRARIDQWQTMKAAQVGMPLALWRLLQQPEVTDVVISGTHAWVDAGKGLVATELPLSGENAVRTMAVKMAAAASRRLDDAQPIVDAVLPGPIRIHAVLPPLAQSGTSISLRVLRSRPFELDHLVTLGTVSDHAAATLRSAVRDGRSILLAGATGAGKTTMLATLLGLVDSDKRIVTIEEVAELAIAHPHVVSLQARAPNIEGEGGVSLEELVRASVRMRPDRIVLGECRGPEVREVLTAMNTGHAGGMATIHANSIEDVPARLEALGMLAGMDRPAVAAMAAAAFDMVVFLKRDPTGARKVQALGELRLHKGTLKGVTTQVEDQ